LEPSTDNAFFITGDPFVDTGTVAICEWLLKSSPQEIENSDLNNLIDDLSEIYVQKTWKNQCHGMLLPNHGKMFNPSLAKYSLQERKEKIRKYLLDLVKNFTTVQEYGNCIACGRRHSLKKVGRSEYPLLGSGTTRNFFSYATDGIDICANCLFAVQIVPIAVYKIGGKLLLLHSNNLKILKYWIKDSVKYAKTQLNLKAFTGFFTPEGYSNSQNAMFDLLTKIIQVYSENWYTENPSITFYYFLNHNQDGDIQITYFPNEIFRFLAQVKVCEAFTEWRKIVRKGYSSIKEGENEKDFRNRRNRVYENLLRGKTIVPYFINFKERTVNGTWELLVLYLEEVRKMKSDRIETIRNLGDRISDYIRKTDDVKRLTQLERSKYYHNLRNVLRLIEKGMIKAGIEEPIFTFDEYVEFLFPEGSMTWRETRDLIVFRIYEKLHDYLVKSGDEEILSEEEEEN
jgi:CRISPR-associated protein Cst1